MYVGMRMLTKVVTVTPKTSLLEAYDLMEKNGLWMLPVVKKGKLVGYLRKEDVHKALPSPATMLSRHELHSIVSKVTVKEFIRKDILTVTPETEIELAAEIMHREDLPGLGVIDSSGRLVGYINRSIMLDVLVEEMGLHRGGKRFTIEFKDRQGVMAEVANIVSSLEINFVSAASFYHNDICILVFRVETDDLSPILKALEERGYNIIDADYFAEDWKGIRP